MNINRIEKYFERFFGQLEEDTKEISEFEKRISKENREGREYMNHKRMNRRLIRNKRQLDE